MIKSTLIIAALLTSVGASAAVKSQSAVEANGPRKGYVEKMRKSAPRLEGEAAFDAPITEAPEGTTVLYYVDGMIYNLNYNYEFEHRPEAGKVGEVVWGKDGYAYIKNPLMNMQTDTYIKGEFEGNDVVFKLPQTLEIMPWGDMEFYYFAQKLYRDGDDDYGYPNFLPVEEDNEIRYTIAGNYMKMAGPDDGSVIFGATDEYGGWNWTGDYNVRYTAFSDKMVAAPDALETKTLQLTYVVDGQNVELGFDGNDVYMKGFSKDFPEAWIKGELADGKISFPSGQYLGIYEDANYFCYMVGAEYVLVEEDGESYYSLAPTDNLVFNYDEATSTLTSEQVMVVNTNRGEFIWYLSAMQTPKIAPAPEVISFVPADPIITSFDPYDEYWGAGNICFDMPCLSVNGNILDTDNLYYRMYVDGELFTFYIDDYKYIEDEEMEDVPYSFTDYFDFFADAAFHRVYFTFQDADQVGIQSVYKNGDEEYVSGIANAITTSVSAVGSANVASESYFDLAGRQLRSADKGIFIKTVRYEDGSVRNFKVAK